MVCHRPFPARIARFSTPYWLLSYTYTGYGLLRTRTDAGLSGWVPRARGSVALFAPGTDFWEDARGERGVLHSVWMHFTDADSAGLGDLLAPDTGTLYYLDPSAVVGDLIAEAAQAVRISVDHGFWRAQSVLLRLIDMLLSRALEAPRPGPPALGRVSSLVRQVDGYLAEHVAERVSLTEIARSIGVSSSTLSHRYRAETGATPITQHRRLRVNHARALLLRRQSLKEVAGVTGFTDAFHLSRTFKQVTGVSPREFQRRAFAAS